MVPLAGNAPNILGTVIPLVILGAIVLPLRLYVRASNRALGWDDWCMVLAAVPWAGLSAVCIGCAFAGVGVDESQLSRDEIHNALMWFWLFEIFWCMAVIPVKISIALMLGRIAVVKRYLIIGLYIMSALLTIITLLGLFYIIFRCIPISYSWDNSIPDGKCQPVRILTYIYYATTAVNIAIDWFCALLPIPLLWNAPLPRREKLSVSFLLGLGVLASVSACVRQRYTGALVNGHDVVYSLSDLVIWGYAEVGIGFFVGSLSTLRPLFWRRPSPYTTSHKEEEQSVHDDVERNRTHSVAAVEMEELSPVSREVEEEFARNETSIGRAI